MGANVLLYRVILSCGLKTPRLILTQKEIEPVTPIDN